MIHIVEIAYGRRWVTARDVAQVGTRTRAPYGESAAASADAAVAKRDMALRVAAECGGLHTVLAIIDHDDGIYYVVGCNREA